MQAQDSYAFSPANFKRIAKLAIPLVLMACTGSKAYAAEFIYCRLVAQDGAYFSDVFQGDYSQVSSIQVAFANNVEGSYGVHGVTTCLFEKDPHESKAKLDALRGSSRSTYGKIVDTHWTY